MRVSWLLWLSLLTSNGLLLAPAGTPFRIGGSLMLLLLPGLIWGWRTRLAQDHLTNLLISLGLSYSLITLTTLLLTYTGWLTPTVLWLTLNLLSLIPLLLPRSKSKPPQQTEQTVYLIALLIITLMTAYFQLASLGHSEFLEDEAEVMLTVADLLNGQSEALFINRRKGPVEALLPAAMWSLTGLIDEATARLLFALAGILTIPTLYRLSSLLFNSQIGLIAAFFLSLNGFVIAFGRRVQYQSLIIWLSLLALLCAWKWRQQGDTRWSILTALFIGIGLLAHYDMVAIVPPLLYLLLSLPTPRRWQPWLLSGGLLILISSLFYLPYLFNEQASTTSHYLLTKRIGGSLLKNTLDNFVQANVMFTAAPYFILTGLAVTAFLVYALAGSSHAPTWRWGLALLLMAGLIGLMIDPILLQQSPNFDLAVLPFILILTTAVVAPHLTVSQRLVVIWLSAAFIGYTFGLTRPRSHIYTLVPAWVILAGFVTNRLTLIDLPRPQRVALLGTGTVMLTALFGSYLHLAYIRADLNWRIPLTEWPNELWRPPLHELTSPYFFGTVNMAYGWRAVGGLYATGQLIGSYYSNDSSHTSAWYTRHAPRQQEEEPPIDCHRQPDYYLVAEPYTLPPKAIDWPRVQDHYQPLGQLTGFGKRHMALYQLTSETTTPPSWDEAALERAFYQTSWPTAYQINAAHEATIQATFNETIQLNGYYLEPQFPRPGGRLKLILNWQTLAPIPAKLVVFVHVTDEGHIWGQSDQQPMCGYYPTNRWQPGQTIFDQHFVNLAPDMPPGNYPIQVGLYHAETGQRLTTEHGDIILLTTISIAE